MSSTGLFVTVGDNGIILTSSDGITWDNSTSGTTKNLYGVTYGNSTFVTGGDNVTILTSSDGTTWTNKRTSSVTTNNLYGVTYGNGTFVTVGDNGVILTSSDGISWTKRTSGGDQPTTTTIVSVSDSGGNIQIESTNHDLDEGDVIRFTTTDTLPTGLALATDYYVVGTPSTNTFFVSEAESGTPIVYTDGGTGTHSWQIAIALGSTGNYQLATHDFANGVVTDSSGNVYVTGGTKGGLDGNTSAGNTDLFVVKYNSSGTKQWTKQLGTSSNDNANGVATDSSGNVYVTGYTYGGLDSNTNWGKNDIFLVKYNSDGVLQ